jgi:hypothetical protein
MKPSIGRVVHYYASAGQVKPFAALITDVHSDTCINVAGFNNGNTQFGQTSVCYNEDPTSGMRWVWPPKV